jgi:hypothetical protein
MSMTDTHTYIVFHVNVINVLMYQQYLKKCCKIDKCPNKNGKMKICINQ